MSVRAEIDFGPENLSNTKHPGVHPTTTAGLYQLFSTQPWRRRKPALSFLGPSVHHSSFLAFSFPFSSHPRAYVALVHAEALDILSTGHGSLATIASHPFWQGKDRSALRRPLSMAPSCVKKQLGLRRRRGWNSWRERPIGGTASNFVFSLRDRRVFRMVRARCFRRLLAGTVFHDNG